jgi:hypothetical protein
MNKTPIGITGALIAVLGAVALAVLKVLFVR